MYIRWWVKNHTQQGESSKTSGSSSTRASPKAYSIAQLQVSIVLGGRNVHRIAACPHVAAIGVAIHENYLEQGSKPVSVLVRAYVCVCMHIYI